MSKSSELLFLFNSDFGKAAAADLLSRDSSNLACLSYNESNTTLCPVSCVVGLDSRYILEAGKSSLDHLNFS